MGVGGQERWGTGPWSLGGKTRDNLTREELAPSSAGLRRSWAEGSPLRACRGERTGSLAKPKSQEQTEDDGARSPGRVSEQTRGRMERGAQGDGEATWA